MATINSHRRRQVFHSRLHRNSYSRHGYANSPSGAATMMPSKETRADDYTSYRREFADIRIMLAGTFLGNTLKRVYDRHGHGKNAAYNDIIRTTPGGFVNPNDHNSPLRYAHSMGTHPVIYLSDLSGAGGIIG